MEIGLVANYLGVGAAFAAILKPLLASSSSYFILMIIDVYKRQVESFTFDGAGLGLRRSSP